jgi:para-aminobenzoate synthetase component 1
LDFKEKLNLLGSKKEPFFFCISYDMSQWEVHKLSQIPNDIKFNIDNKYTNYSTNNNTQNNTNYKLKNSPIPFIDYKDKFNTIQKQIRNGNTYLVNLTAKSNITTNLTLKDLYKIANAKFKLYFKDKFICFSPERFVKCTNNKIYTYPMKGTIDASIHNAKQIILTDNKELAEHTMVVDLLRNDLSIVSSNVKVDKFRYCEKIDAGDKQLLQISSQISGQLKDNWQNNIGDILTSILPAGSITGTPKKQTINILNKIEDYNREFFTGIFGVLMEKV